MLLLNAMLIFDTREYNFRVFSTACQFLDQMSEKKSAYYLGELLTVLIAQMVDLIQDIVLDMIIHKKI